MYLTLTRKNAHINRRFCVTLFFMNHNMYQICLTLFVLTSICAKTHYPPPTKRIINGVPITSYQCPYYAMLYYGGVHSGGVIIEEDVILTAASVVDGFSDTDIEIFVGVTDIGDTYTRFVYDNNKTIKHPNYQYGNANYDVALMFLGDRLGMSGNVQKINLTKTAAPVGSVVRMCGFGYPRCNRTNNANERCKGVASRVLRDGIFAVNKYQNNTMYATGINGVSSCFGDFGGPVTRNNELVGVASLIQNLDCTGYNLIVSIPPVRGWIEQTIRLRKGRKN